MKHKKRISSLLFFLMSLGFAQAQEAVLPSGGEATGAGGSASYSVGQPAYTTNTGATGTVSQGVQQPYSITTTLGEEVTDIKLELSVYPNPTQDYLKLKIESDLWTDLSFQLFDMEGKLITERKLIESNTSIKMQNLPVATYFLRVAHGQKVIKTFKIIKT